MNKIAYKPVSPHKGQAPIIEVLFIIGSESRQVSRRAPAFTSKKKKRNRDNAFFRQLHEAIVGPHQFFPTNT